MADAGRDRLEGFELGANRLDLRGLGLSDEAAALAQTQDVNGSAVFSAGDVAITLAGVSVAQLQGADFLV